MSGTGARRRRSRDAFRIGGRVPGVVLVLLGVLALPLTVGSILGAERVDRLQDRRTNLEVLADSGARLSQLSSLRVASMEERLLDGALLALDLYDIDPGLASLAAGFDFEAEAAAAKADVDRLLVDLGGEPAAAIGRERRRDFDVGDLLAFNAGYLAVESTIVGYQVEQQRRLDRALAALEDSDELRDRQANLEAAIGSHRRLSEMSAAYIGVLLLATSLPPEDQIRSLHEHRFSYAEATGELTPVDRARLDAEPAIDALVALVDDALDTAARDGADALLIDVEQGSVASLLPIRDVFTDTSAATDVHREIVDGASARLAASIADADAAVRADIQRSYLALGALGLATIVGLWVATALIVTPLRRLIAGAGALQSGAAAEPVSPTGVREVRAAARAINEAASSLRMAEQRSRELASSVLAGDRGAHQAIDRELERPGHVNSVGAALHASLEQLHELMQEREELRARLQYEASHDPMTGLFNRRGFRVALEARWSERGGVDPTVFYLDLNRFKQVNDTYGHSVGDELLISVADRLRAVSSGDEIVARMGGDEFVIVGFDPDPDFGARLGAEITAAVRAPFVFDVGHVEIDASVGYARSRSGVGLGRLVQQADMAAYYAKAHRADDPVGFGDEVAIWMRGRPTEV